MPTSPDTTLRHPQLSVPPGKEAATAATLAAVTAAVVAAVAVLWAASAPPRGAAAARAVVGRQWRMAMAAARSVGVLEIPNYR